MTKRIWLLGLLFALGVLAGLGATSVFAQAPTTTQTGNSTWQQMYQACDAGDYQAMEKLHDEYCDGQNGMMGAGGMLGNWQGSGSSGGMMGGQNGMMGNWQGGSYGGGMMGGGRGGMMGGWYR